MTKERQYVDECPRDGCQKTFLGMSPDDVRDHIEEDHDEPLGRLYAFPDRSVGTGSDREGSR
jgi:hypothetical protein